VKCNRAVCYADVGYLWLVGFGHSSNYTMKILSQNTVIPSADTGHFRMFLVRENVGTGRYKGVLGRSGMGRDLLGVFNGGNPGEFDIKRFGQEALDIVELTINYFCGR
jgi:hypothetical protein